MTRFALIASAILLSGCGQPMHMGRDYGRAYTEAFITQGDLTRPSVVTAAYGLTGNEAAGIRLAAEDAVSDQADTTITLTAK